jgi:hypothetical protein
MVQSERVPFAPPLEMVFPQSRDKISLGAQLEESGFDLQHS